MESDIILYIKNRQTFNETNNTTLKKILEGKSNLIVVVI